jgi:hypothetical protein
MIRKLICLFLFLVACLIVRAQQDKVSYNLGISAGYISSDRVPFWLRSNQFGSVPLDKGSLGLTGAVHRDYNKKTKKLFDWGFSAEGRINLGDKSNLRLIEGYAKARLSVFELRVGRSKEIMGLCDTSLTTGSWAVSGNALGIPKVQISIPEFYSIPFLGNLFAFKGTYSHGWFGVIPVGGYNNVFSLNTYLHQKSLYGRFGKPEWRLKLYGGFNHQVLWGNEKKYWGSVFDLTPMQTYLYVITGRGWHNSRMGDELGSIDLGLEYNFKKIRLFAYRQNLYEAGALYYLANILDGLNGLSVENRVFVTKGFKWRKFLVEVLYTKDQAGEPWSKHTPSGDEDYYNHYMYVQGWSYKGIGIGNPFITPREYTRKELANSPGKYFINNRVAVVHLGFEGSINSWELSLKSSYSLNYGTYSTSAEYKTANGLFGTKKQFSTYLDVSKKLKNEMRLGITGAFDRGELYYDAYGVMVRASKAF